MSIEVTNNETEQRYEIHVDNKLAGFARYRLHPDAVVFVHTEVFDDFEGRGLGGELARGALDDVRARDLKIRPMCPFIASYVERHPAYQDLVLESADD